MRAPEIIEAELMEIGAIADDTIKLERIIACCASHPDEIPFALHQLINRHTSRRKPIELNDCGYSREQFRTSGATDAVLTEVLRRFHAVAAQLAICRGWFGSASWASHFENWFMLARFVVGP